MGPPCMGPSSGFLSVMDPGIGKLLPTSRAQVPGMRSGLRSEWLRSEWHLPTFHDRNPAFIFPNVPTALGVMVI